MEERVIKAGWVHKRSAYLKQWRKRWLVLKNSSLSTFKSKDLTQAPTMNLSIADITEAVASVLEFERDFCFKILSGSEYFMIVESDKEMCLWLNLINHVRLGRSFLTFNAPHYSREVKAQSDESLITSFSQTKAILNEREAELTNDLFQFYEKYKLKAEDEHKILNETLNMEIQNCETIASSLGNQESILDKIQQIQKLTKVSQKFQQFDSINESKLQLTLEPNTVEKLIRPFVKISLKSQAELSIRRSWITRALKWRYTGSRIDALTFSVSSDIELVGVGICGPYKSGGQIIIKEFQVLKGNSSNSPTLYRNSEPIIIKYDPEESVHRIRIEDPIFIKKESKYTVIFVIEGSHTFKCVDCLAVVEKEATWKFFNTNFSQSHHTNRCDVTCGPIADFYYLST